ncbi:Leucine-rich repeat and WD repeat-containing protein [Aphelenchoides bicaudatus]|nr:Leucine-rich repeat and WD repeat-containing protein [Aphelenchoides bicaudatus]
MNIHKMLAVNSNQNHIVLMDNETRGAVWDIKNKKIVRHLPAFTGVLTQDGRLGLNAPNRGGLHVVDIKTGGVMRTLIGQVAEGVNDVKAMFTSTGEHVLYYHSGHQTLRAFRVADGQLIGTFRPHARITTWSSDSSGERIVIGGQDGSLLTAFLYDEKAHPETQRSLACLPSRKYLADFLGITVEETDESENADVRNLTIVTKAVQKFKNLTLKNQNSAVCSIQ